MTAAVDHYAVLGVSPRADRATIRRAWHDAAKAAHPDRAGDPIARRAAEESIRRINEAWRVLGDEALRRDYDRARAAGMAAGPSAPTSGKRAGRSTSRPAAPPRTTTVAPTPVPMSRSHARWGWVPAILVGVVLLLIVVFSAYVTSNDSSNTSTTTAPRADAAPSVGSCVVVSPSGSGLVATPIECTSPNSGRVIAIVETPRPCPSGDARQLADHRTTLCLVPS